MTAALWFKSFSQFLAADGAPYPAAVATFYVGNTTTPLIVYQDNALASPWGSSVTADAAGLFPAVFLPEGTYDFRVVTSTGVQICEAGPIEAVPTVTVSSGGGTVDPETIFQTGDTLFLEYSGTRSGWIRDNGRTIGNALSGATERANADTAALFAWYWDNFADAICPVSGGRGGSAAADYAAGKTITTLDKRGRAAVGLDTMGNTAANRIQVSTTVSTTNASTSATVGSATGLAVGMYVVSTNVPSGATITAISGTTITLSAAATATAAGTAARFSWFVDAQVAGRMGGEASVTLTTDGLPAHTHTGTTASSGTHNHNVAIGNVAGVGGSAAAGDATNISTSGSAGAHTHTFTTAATGNGKVHSNMIPAVLGTWYRKL